MTSERVRNGRWSQAVPLPLYVRSWRTLFRWRFQCQCREVFDDETLYQANDLLAEFDGLRTELEHANQECDELRTELARLRHASTILQKMMRYDDFVGIMTDRLALDAGELAYLQSLSESETA